MKRAIGNPFKKLGSLMDYAQAYGRNSEKGLFSISNYHYPRNYHISCSLQNYFVDECGFKELKEANPTLLACNLDIRKTKFVQLGFTGSISASIISQRLFSASSENDSSDIETVKGVYDKLLDSITKKRTAPPNALLWSLIAKCSSKEDIELLYDLLQKLRIFRLSNLRIHDDFNTALCREVTKACVRAGAIDFGMKALWKHNVFGLTPDIGSVHHLLLYAKQNNDINLLVEIMKLVKKNELTVQAGTVDIVFSICSNSDRWEMMSKYGKQFVMSGIKLRQTSFDIWMDFAVRRGDTKSLWKIEKWRSESMKKHSLSTGFSCARGFLLDDEPENAAAVIQMLTQKSRMPDIELELQKLASKWPLELTRHNKENDEAFAAKIQSNLAALMNALRNLGVDANIRHEA